MHDVEAFLNCLGKLWEVGLLSWMDGWIGPGQIIATSHDLTLNGGLVREIPLFQGNRVVGEILFHLATMDGWIGCMAGLVVCFLGLVDSLSLWELVTSIITLILGVFPTPWSHPWSDDAVIRNFSQMDTKNDRPWKMYLRLRMWRHFGYQFVKFQEGTPLESLESNRKIQSLDLVLRKVSKRTGIINFTNP